MRRIKLFAIAPLALIAGFFPHSWIGASTQSVKLTQRTSTLLTQATKEPLCTCWVSQELPSGNVWDCRLWGKLNGWGWWWFYPQGQEPSLSAPDELRSGKCQVTDGKREQEEQQLGIERPPQGMNPSTSPISPNNPPPSSNSPWLVW